MKKLIIAIATALSLAIGVAGSAAALPDNQACTHASGTPGIAALADLGGCEPHGAP